MRLAEQRAEGSEEPVGRGVSRTGEALEPIARVPERELGLLAGHVLERHVLRPQAMLLVREDGELPDRQVQPLEEERRVGAVLDADRRYHSMRMKHDLSLVEAPEGPRRVAELAGRRVRPPPGREGSHAGQVLEGDRRRAVRDADPERRAHVDGGRVSRGDAHRVLGPGDHRPVRKHRGERQPVVGVAGAVARDDRARLESALGRGHLDPHHGVVAVEGADEPPLPAVVLHREAERPDLEARGHPASHRELPPPSSARAHARDVATTARAIKGARPRARALPGLLCRVALC